MSNNSMSTLLEHTCDRFAKHGNLDHKLARTHLVELVNEANTIIRQNLAVPMAPLSLMV